MEAIYKYIDSGNEVYERLIDLRYQELQNENMRLHIRLMELSNQVPSAPPDCIPTAPAVELVAPVEDVSGDTVVTPPKDDVGASPESDNGGNDGGDNGGDNDGNGDDSTTVVPVKRVPTIPPRRSIIYDANTLVAATEWIRDNPPMGTDGYETVINYYGRYLHSMGPTASSVGIGRFGGIARDDFGMVKCKELVNGAWEWVWRARE